MYGASETVNVAATKTCNGGRPRSQKSGSSPALIARIVEALIRIAGNVMMRSVWDNRDGRTAFRVVERAGDRHLRRLYGAIHRLKGHTGPRGDEANLARD